jgi:hypothetical protein
VLLFGGIVNRSQWAGDTWILKAGRWMQLEPKSNPVGRKGAALVDDPEMHAVVLFGGQGTSGQPLDDMWAWNGLDWVQLQPAHRPSARFGAAVAFDAVRHVVLLFGGNTVEGGGSLNDTWTWNGQDWTEAVPAESPPARGFARLAVDTAHGEAVLFGGFEALQDTWTWDGSTWTEQHPTNTPPGIHEANAMNEQLVYDSARKVIVFAGPDEVTLTTRTFIWSGTDWTPETPVASPPDREGPGLAYDDADGITVYAGGFAAANTHGVDTSTTWGWDGTNWVTLG